MRILAVDDELPGLGALKSAIAKAEPDAEICAFQFPRKALEFVQENDVYAALLDIQMAGMSGIELAKKIKLTRPTVHIIFATGFDSFMKDTFQLHANGYILKPVTASKVRAELDNLKNLRDGFVAENAANAEPADGKRVRIQCFGNFEVFADGKPLHFKYDKTKEVLAYVVSRRGALCTNSEIIVNVWDDDVNHDSYLRGIRKDLVDMLKELDLEDILNTQRGKLGIDVSKVSCDYYDFIAGDVNAINSYAGEFMSQYSFAEMINAELDIQRYKD